MTIKNRTFILAVCWSVIASVQFLNAQNKQAFEVSKNFNILHTLYGELNQFYVDSVKPEVALGKAIEGLMSAYDPYTNYIAEAETDELKFITTGEYGGVGAIIGQRNGRVLVLEPYQGLPAQKSGLQYGDVLLEIGGLKMVGSDMNRASELLRGGPGTTVEVVYMRSGLKKPVKKIITRELIQMNQVTWFGLVGEKVGYINLNSFTTKSTQEVRNALNQLKSMGAENLILDLRGNGGGLLDEAVSICNLFVPKGQEIVRTKGRVSQSDRIYKTIQQPIDTLMPLVVLVNSGSASSSEIVAGALQDLDRAVILGNRTFGKGLVQTTRSIPYNGVLKITTAKYYIPSGRCIQAIDYSSRNEDGSVGRIPDSLTHVFKTKSGRPVRDGGGIVPDVKCMDQLTSQLAMDLIDSLYFFEYANRYFQKHEKIGSVSDFKLQESDLRDFLSFIQTTNFKYENRSFRMLEKLKQVIKEDGMFEQTAGDIQLLESKLAAGLETDFQAGKSEIEMLLESEIVSRYYFQAGKLQSTLKYDPCVQKAIGLFMEKNEMNIVLRPAVPAL